MDRLIVEAVETVNPTKLSEQIEAAMEKTNDTVLTYQPNTFKLTSFETDVGNPLLATAEGSAQVCFCETIESHARVIAETRRLSGSLESDELEQTQIYLTVREFN